MKTLLRILLTLVLLVVLVGVLAYADGTTLAVDHTATVTGIVAAPPAKVFALITNVAEAARWRHQLKSVKLLPPVYGPSGEEDHWIEDLGHGTTMNFLAVRTDALTPQGRARREVFLHDPSYGGTWTYEIAPAADPGQTTLTITEDGYIHPPIYRFMMAHVFGMTRNLNQYLSDIQAAATQP